jgi:hypothetical protein
MSVTPTYLVDTSCFTQAYRQYYSFDIAPSFWEFLRKSFENGLLLCNDKVYDEIQRGSDDLAVWLKTEVKKDAFIDTKSDIQILEHYGLLMHWANDHPNYNPIAKADFAAYENADAWVVATAIENRLIVISQEISAPDSKRIIKLPDVCKQFNIKHIDTFSFLRKAGFSM